MNEIFLLKFGELFLKGTNRYNFENKLKGVCRHRLRLYGDFNVYILQSTLYVEPENEDCDLEGAWEVCCSLFGIASVCRCASCEKDVEKIYDTVVSYLGDDLAAARSFKVEGKRSDKRFPLNSIQLAQEIGGRLAEEFPAVAVDVHHPEYTVYVEVRERAVFVHGPAVPGAGGLPTGTSGRGAVLLSGGIDSPVAAHMMAKRGMELEGIHFFSYPYTSELAKEKVLDLAKIVTRYCGRMSVFVVGFTEIQEAIRDNCDEDYFTIIMRRFMMRIAERIAKNTGCQCLITGESLGQVASQTMQAMATTNAVCELPVFRPVIGMDKEEIVTISRRIGAFETSIRPYEDCCTVFTPKHPRTKPTLKAVEDVEKALDVDALVERAVANTEKITVSYYAEEE